MSEPNTPPPEPTPAPQLPEWLSVGEAAAHLRVSKKALYGAIKAHDVPIRRIGKVIRVRRDYVLGTDLAAPTKPARLRVRNERASSPSGVVP